jgi:hypothetical protein
MDWVASTSFFSCMGTFQDIVVSTAMRRKTLMGRGKSMGRLLTRMISTIRRRRRSGDLS